MGSVSKSLGAKGSWSSMYSHATEAIDVFLADALIRLGSLYIQVRQAGEEISTMIKSR